ncbi:MAG TPA: choice-of-anchor tandem repeat GloVer-containing protein, partial [Bryobacteraceae bacterium]|nr:choice-of-anchor tandem repeat GloVer-containing protein [Bryobacteraceae bacterium]
MTTTGTLTTLHNFAGGADDGYPNHGLTLGADGNFYGVTDGAGTSTQNGIGFRITPTGTLTVLANFEINQPLNEGPKSNLVLASDGNFYGVDLNHLFKMTPTGTVTNVYPFCQQANCLDGAGPDAVVLGADGNVYGTANFGGSGTCMFSAFLPAGCGVVFKWTVSQSGPPPPPGPTITLVANAEG